ncbi:Lung seven transmembrane receptor-like [Trema orientale]|uniref:Lung seven transmembrane receptor-like n=1 Tax=Trema orientale TaxID=63057 RepID=A0A2P5BMN1_TREOI|nr:Lung seven transmembrane receptor-like [Trema orientale]
MEFRPRIHNHNDFSVFFFLLLSTIAITAHASIHIYNNQTFREVGNSYLLSGGSEGIVASLTTTADDDSSAIHNGRSYIRYYCRFWAPPLYFYWI